MSNKNIVFLDCPFDEKEDAKQKGAQWDRQSKKWFVPTALYREIEQFNRWKPNGRMYLNCPYSEKNEAKQRGAKFDGALKKWYFVPDDNCDEELFAKWLPGIFHFDDVHILSQNSHNSNRPNQIEPEDTLATRDSCKNGDIYEITEELLPSSGETSIAVLPRINKDMTVKQLQDECRRRDPSIQGLSSKSKQWLLQHLQIGTVWTIASSKMGMTNELGELVYVKPSPTKSTTEQNSGKRTNDICNGTKKYSEPKKMKR